ncbi:hypothetical protein Lal_00020916 [Lupinus albus]|uniref:Putative VASt domain-containing protein n=1 Tax=Lupinus albus TaxID=3870 RepID=A0A6A5MKC4_LUPAL|nr:putative VASt domain-containing protein [Lupinus albus]KAF1871182.1 hypothetical protein Lal_00020916 [Lupinus albus]
MAEGNELLKVMDNPLDSVFNEIEESSKEEDSTKSVNEDNVEQNSSPCSFEAAIALMESMEYKNEMPANLSGGILVDHIYAVSPHDLNVFLFAPNSKFRKDLEALQGTTNAKESPWAWKSEDMSCLTRVVAYTKAATKLVKAVNTTEEQTYIRVTKEEFCVHLNIGIPEIPFSNTFKMEMLYKIMPGGLSSGEVSSKLVVSWGIVFIQRTIMKSFIVRGIRQGIKESFDQFCNLLAQNFKVI